LEPKKILILAASLRVGGAEKFCRDIALCAPPGYEFHYIVFDKAPGEYEPALLARGCTIFHDPPPGPHYIKYGYRLTRRMRREGYAAVHAHNMFGCGWAMLAGYLAGVPVRIAHAHSSLKESAPWRQTYEWAMGALIGGFSTHRLACSEDAGARLFGVHPWTTVPNGIRREDFRFSAADRAEIRRRYGLERATVIGHAGHFNRVKNQKFLVSLLPRLRELGDFRLLLLGDGADRETVKAEISRLKLEEYVILPGNVDEIGPFYSAMDVFALPSLYEGLPLALLEARSSGLPCVISDTVGFRDDGTCALSLEDGDAWVRELSAIRGRIPGEVWDIRDTMAAIYAIYEGGNP